MCEKDFAVPKAPQDHWFFQDSEANSKAQHKRRGREPGFGAAAATTNAASWCMSGRAPALAATRPPGVPIRSHQFARGPSSRHPARAAAGSRELPYGLYAVGVFVPGAVVCPPYCFGKTCLRSIIRKSDPKGLIHLREENVKTQDIRKRKEEKVTKKHQYEIRLLDLCILAIDSLEFQYRILAAAALCHFTSIEVVKKASGLEWDNISECVDWMVPFVSVVKNTTPVKLKTFKKILMEDRHNIQTHTNYLAMLVKGATDDVAEADTISMIELNHSGELLATGDKGGRVVIFQQEQENKTSPLAEENMFTAPSRVMNQSLTN
ncbi:G1/S-specific cyclin-E2 [Tupaia chinensis]|uniref:G1/S-specific cyclin-E2 n=1 Tax=Tupaia chinensis TaxID=246437 RepID=L8YD60_TUPCH|nr:G1/S-specific cyclin-E2 [Tupaia chinensis]